MNYTIASDPICRFNLNFVKSFRFAEDGCFLEITDWSNTVYKKFYRGNREKGIKDYNTIVHGFQCGMY